MIPNEKSICFSSAYWDEFLSLLPKGWRKLAIECGLTKGLRKDKDPGDYLHLLIMHLLCGFSLRETAAYAEILGMSKMSDVAILKRLRKSELFLRKLCMSFLDNLREGEICEGFRLRLIDGTNIKEPGQFGTLWRIHFSFDMQHMECDELKLTKTSGKGTGEDFRQFLVNEGDVLVADRGYCRLQGLLHVVHKGGFFIVRANTQTLNLFDEKGSALRYTKILKSIQTPLEKKEFNAVLRDTENNTNIHVRVCVIKKDDEAAAKARRELKRIASKKQHSPTALSLLATGYVILIANLPADVFPLNEVLECYRLRWQIELTFKRMKSLLGIGALPKYTDSSSRAWLYGKLLIALIIERCSSHWGAFSPWCGQTCKESIGESLGQLQMLAGYTKGMGTTNNISEVFEDQLEEF